MVYAPHFILEFNHVRMYPMEIYLKAFVYLTPN